VNTDENRQIALSSVDLSKHFVGRQSIAKKIRKEAPLIIPAVDGVTIDLYQGETLGLVGESGCGKSTLGRTLVGLYGATSGSIYLNGVAVTDQRTLEQRRSAQMIFQDPFSSLNPQMTIRKMLTEILLFHKLRTKENVNARCEELMKVVGLPLTTLDSHPRQFSGGQRQRIGIARALALEPKILIADEAVSALDVSVQATIVNLLLDLRRDLGLSILFISHNISVVRQMCDRIAVMYLGRIVEIGSTEQVFTEPRHPYTKLLLGSVPKMHANSQVANLGSGELPALQSHYDGCRFMSRCTISSAECASIDPQLHKVGLISSASSSGSLEIKHEVACIKVLK
jgi:oligopeptide/dipeptide ABC transporter ATP-binding protein